MIEGKILCELDMEERMENPFDRELMASSECVFKKCCKKYKKKGKHCKKCPRL